MCRRLFWLDKICTKNKNEIFTKNKNKKYVCKTKKNVIKTKIKCVIKTKIKYVRKKKVSKTKQKINCNCHFYATVEYIERQKLVSSLEMLYAMHYCIIF
jgi:hypothetical protein